MDVSIVVPVFNEEENVEILYEEVKQALQPTGREWELVFVDDGSTDGTFERLKRVADYDKRVKLIQLRKNYGQTAALQAGIDAAVGQIIVTMDGDLQNDPADIPRMIAKLEEGYDVVHGWRRKRQDRWLTRKLPSRVANWIIRRLTGVPAHDLGCTLRVMRCQIAKELELYGEMHRFIPVLVHWRGARAAEVETNHRARMFGKTKYGLGRTIRVILDLMTVKFMLDYFPSPMKLFGSVGLLSFAAGLVALLATVAMKLFQGIDMTGNPLLLLSAFAVLAAIQFVSLGLLGEVCIRVYFNTTDRRNYAIRHKVNFDATSKVQELQKSPAVGQRFSKAA